MSEQLKGKVALITGGGSGIGAAIAKRYVAEGAKVVITGRRVANLQETVDACPKGTVLPFAGDVQNPEDCEKMINATVEFGGGKIDILVNNAGIDSPAGSVADLAPESFRKILETNLFGSFYTMHFAIPKFIEQGGGVIVNVASLAALRCPPALPAYIASKHGIVGLTQSVANDYGKYNIRANVICPGATATAMLENAMAGLAEQKGTDIPGALKFLTRFTPLGRAAAPEEIAGAAVFFASDDSSFITGAVLPIEGGASVVDPCGSSTSDAGLDWGGGQH
ncbi:MAG: SDR family oxidoreductase [Oscillospiraceae bacterium]|jgi:NAD(P)-dependent dehydrogenase (short-subunit alcohol dehydrogenase family)|nr:SDR family oxidoreductase [Oscillospiraceae bacterium]